MDGKILTKVSHPGNKRWVWIWQPLPSKLIRICKAKRETQKEVVKNEDILLFLIFNVFFFLDRPLCCHESLGGRYQIIAFDVRITQHIISKILWYLGILWYSSAFFSASVFCSLCRDAPSPQKGEGGVCRQATFFVVRLHFLPHFE